MFQACACMVLCQIGRRTKILILIAKERYKQKLEPVRDSIALDRESIK